MPILIFVFIIFSSTLINTANADDRKLVILVPGGEGDPKPIDFLMRNKSRFDNAGFKTAIGKSGREIGGLARSAQRNGQDVYIVAMSIGVLKSAHALGRGAMANAAVFFSGNYDRAKSSIGSPDNLPPTLLIHHRKDACPGTTPKNVEPFKAWSSGKVQNIVWIVSTGKKSQPCGPVGAHGFFRKDNQPIDAAIQFIKSR